MAYNYNQGYNPQQQQQGYPPQQQGYPPQTPTQGPPPGYPMQQQQRPGKLSLLFSFTFLSTTHYNRLSRKKKPFFFFRCFICILKGTIYDYN